jgi:hypothetical protein
MGHEIRKYMYALDDQGPLDGHIEADETLVGGRDPLGRKGRAKSNKTTVFAMLDRESGEVISKVVPDAKGKTLKREIDKHVLDGSTIHNRRARRILGARSLRLQA